MDWVYNFQEITRALRGQGGGGGRVVVEIVVEIVAANSNSINTVEMIVPIWLPCFRHCAKCFPLSCSLNS